MNLQVLFDWSLRWRTVSWAIAAVVAGSFIAYSLANQTPWGQPWQDSNVILLDFRDTIVAPGRFLWQGGNPYDPQTYLAAHPWAQEFDPYAPAWLLVAAVLGPLPIKLSAGLYLVGASILLGWFAHALLQLVRPAWASALAPWLTLWFLIWYPTRVMGSSFLCTVGALIALRALAQGREARWIPAIGLAIMLLKPQLGLWLCILLAVAGHWKVVLRGVFCLVGASVVPLVACIVASGGPIAFAHAILRDIAYALSPQSPTGVVGSQSYRFDLLGLYMRLAEASAPTWLLVATVAFFVISAFLLRRLRQQRDLYVVATIPLLLVMPVHATYDIILAALAGAFAWRYVLAHASYVSVAMAVCATLPILHLHRISAALGVSRNAADIFDLAVVVMAGFLAVVASQQASPDTALTVSTRLRPASRGLRVGGRRSRSDHSA